MSAAVSELGPDCIVAADDRVQHTITRLQTPGTIVSWDNIKYNITETENRKVRENKNTL